MDSEYKIIMPDRFDKQAEYEMTLKGYLEGVTVLSKDGTKFPLCFIDPGRVSQELDLSVQRGRQFYAEPGLIVIPVVTMEAIKKAIDKLWKEGFFRHQDPSRWSFLSNAEKSEE